MNNRTHPHASTNPLRLDTSALPAWACTLVIRGVEVPTLSPMDAADRSVVNLGERRRGALVRLWRWAFGDPARRVADDHETRELRHTVAAFIPPEHRRLLEGVGGGELMVVLGNYIGAQQAWYARIERAARAAAEAAAPAPAPTPTGARHGKRVSVPPVRLVPGEPLPAITSGLVNDFRRPGGEGHN